MRAIAPALTASPSGAHVTVKGTERYADTHGWCYYSINLPQKLQCQERHLDPILDK